MRLTSSSGQPHEIRHPEMAMPHADQHFDRVDVSDDGVPAEFKIIFLMHVTAIEPLTNQAA